MLVRAPLASNDCRHAVNGARPEVLLGNASRKFYDQGIGDTTARNAMRRVSYRPFCVGQPIFWRWNARRGWYSCSLG